MTEYNNAFMEVPRFGHTVDFSILFGDSASDKTDYTLGTIFIGALFSAFFVAWLVLLVIFMCQGPQRVGFLAGFQMKHPWWKETHQTPIIVRSVFVFSCLVVITGTVLTTFSFGLKDLKSATDASKEIVTSFSQITMDGNSIVKNTILELSDFQNLRDTIVNELRADNFCPDKDLDAKSGQPVNELRNDLVQDLYNLEDFGQANFTELQNSGFEEMKRHTESMEYYVDMFGVKSWHLWFYMASFTAISFFMMTGTILAWVGRPLKTLTSLNTWFHLPVFLVLVTLLWTLLSFYSVGLVMTADFCSAGSSEGNPDESTSKIVNLTQDEYLQGVYRYWIKGDCESSDFPLVFIPTMIGNLNRAKESIVKLVTAMDLATNLESICGRDYVVIRGYLTLLSGDYSKLGRNATAAMDYLSCDTVYPLYVDLVHDTTCKDAPESGVWAFGTLLLVSFFSMLMITFRSAWLETISADRSGSPISSFEYEATSKPQDLGRKIEENSAQDDSKVDNEEGSSNSNEFEIKDHSDYEVNHDTTRNDEKIGDQCQNSKDEDDNGIDKNDTNSQEISVTKNEDSDQTEREDDEDECKGDKEDFTTETPDDPDRVSARGYSY